MTSFQAYARAWVSNLRGDTLSGIVVALALIPEAIGFSVIAGVDPKVGLYASVVIAIVIAFAGGRPAMISAATAATAVVMVDLVRDHGVQYLFAATILMGLIQILAGLLKLGRLMRFVSQSVMTGFVNALAILIFLAQLPELVHVPAATYGLIALGLAIIYGVPCLTRAVPSPLVAIVVLTLVTAVFHLDVRTVAHLGALPSTLPSFALPDVPLTFETLRILLPVAMTLAAVGLLESLLTAQIVDDMTDTGSSKNRECAGQGVANIASACFGGMGGCAMIGQSVINVSSGARGRLSTLVAGGFLLVLLVALQDLLAVVPVAALTAVMIMVSLNTFSWRSLAALRTNPLPSSAVMLATVLVVVATRDLAIGVLVGVLLSGVFFAGKVSRLNRVTSELSLDGETRTYRVTGQVFFASARTFADAIDVLEPVERIVIDVHAAHFWDISAVAALDRVVVKARARGRVVEVVGLNAASATLVERHGTHDKAGAALAGH
ncbi:SulP family inorganic anion transporter [Methylobacterium haplocladii]|uniref:Sodium-independent anion transporter n=1 Tax=Methylobacterium haplocladii TaxID=1176176 RepID=A0A512IQG5_9HYPH|nr:SulP family inorganic anion transporter [Methylobacterium haplocladii]GEO99956.1 sodium-independent anion transporter [Methylobacterium haplocladii]GJD86225.1 C4-dicarboxylic acid transporter DauA [Methylobacterium haplocladii]GLS59670.1 sodium-independent anion transporter [Methylobacterium haplocladii]